MEAKPRVVFLLGGPGSGKGTIASSLVEKYGFVHMSAGDLLRAEVAKGGELADELNSYMKNGLLVPGEVTVK
jgi:UMP-CMP kinase